MIGLIVLALALAEGSATDWLPLLMVDGHGFDPASSALVYAGFTAAMTVGRFSGTLILQRFSREVVIRASALSGALGIALVIFSNHPIVAAASVLFWGLGAALGFPVGISAAGDSSEHSAKRVAAVATVGYLAFLIGPPSLGFLGQAFGLRMAMILVLVLVAATALLAPAVRERHQSTTSKVT
jgi:fucose permease